MANIINNTESGERLSFFKLFSEKAYFIEIPIIQRDYAQGRNSTSEVRETFLGALYDYLEENKPNRDLDFVYGSINHFKGHSNFIPLDGQQRLTTLFLLHWYLAITSDNMKTLREELAVEDIEDEKKVYKSKFTYETRTSSKEFCDALISNEIIFSELLMPDKGKDNSLSKTIQNCGWFYLSWNNDPTIQSMLTMLDAIHLKFVDKKEYFGRLIDKENPIITFLFLNLKEFKLTDDLYIKMNARGMPLTTFENFKAKFEQHIGQIVWNKKDLRQLNYLEAGNTEKLKKEVLPREYFSHKIDADWANLFWKYRNVTGKDNSFDNEIMNFLRVLMANEYAGTKGLDLNLEFLIGTQIARKKKGYTDNLTYYVYKNLDILNNSSISYLIDALDCLENGNQEIKKHLNTEFYFNEDETFKKVLRHDLTLPQRVQFHSYLKYLIQENVSLSGIDQWMRVVHNFTENTRIDGAAEVSSAILAINKLIPYSQDILDYLQISTNQVDFFLGRQVQEEKIKAHLIIKSERWLEAVEEIEKHPYFKGQIAFILEFSGILSYYEENLDCGWTATIDSEYYEKFCKYSKSASVCFDAKDSEKKQSSSTINFLWERAVLSKGDYLIHSSAWRKNLLSTTINFRDFSWKRLLRLPPLGANDDDVLYWKNRRNFVKDVFDDKDFDNNNLQASLQIIIKSPIYDWRKHFIDNPELISYCEQGYIRFESENKIVLYKQSQQNHRQREMYTYSMYLDHLKNKIEDFSPFLHCEHEEVRNGEDYSFAGLNDFCINRINYSLQIYFDETNGAFPHPYQIKFDKSKGDKLLEAYPDDIKKILKECNFVWYDEEKDWMGFWKTEKSDSKSIDTIKNLCKLLN